MPLFLLERRLCLWALRLLSGVACVIALGLVWMKATGQITAWRGCGEDGGCSGLLGGRWSQWFGIPVSVLAGCVYAMVFVLTWPSILRSPGRTVGQLLTTLAWVMFLAALWFGGVLIFVEKRLCPVCLSLHGLGMLMAAIIFVSACRSARLGEGATMRSSAVSGATALVALVLGQLFGPRPATHEITGSALAVAPIRAPETADASYSAKTLAHFFPNSKAPVVLTAAHGPILGAQDATYFFAECFDYTCAACRDLHNDLKELKKRWPGKFAVIALPTPLNRSCNPWLSASVQDHPSACELARFALAVWTTKPEAFADFHDFLMAQPLPITSLGKVQAQAETLLGKAALESALASPALGEIMAENLKIYASLALTNLRMPKLLLHGDTVMHGTASSTEAFLAAIEQQFRTPSVPSTPVSTPPR
jgi:uncharacterized membrane protein